MSLAALLRRVGGWREPSDSDAVDMASTARSSARTHIGRVRAVNEDRLLDCPARGLWAVADGMGGHSAGDVAATAVIDALQALAGGSAPLDRAAIADALSAANRNIFRASSRTAHVSGSTVAGLVLDGARFLLFWVGDSRVYRRDAAGLELLTRDHSLVQELVDAGTIGPDEAVGHPRANVITRALGIADEARIEFRAGTATPGDLFLICSDGLSSLVPGDALARLLERPIEQASAALLEQALQAGGSDNISVIAVEVGAAR